MVKFKTSGTNATNQKKGAVSYVKAGNTRTS